MGLHSWFAGALVLAAQPRMPALEVRLTTLARRSGEEAEAAAAYARVGAAPAFFSVGETIAAIPGRLIDFAGTLMPHGARAEHRG